MTASALIDTYAQFPIRIASGTGAHVRDAAGREYWDLYGGHAVALIGHAHPAVTHAISAQAAKLTFYSNAVPLDIRDEAAARLCALAPRAFEKVYFCNSGAEANENALKLAIRQTGRQRIAALAGAFHGRTTLALAATDSEKLQAPLAGLLCPTVRLRPNALDEIERIDASVAAVLVEPIQSMAGVIELEPEYLRSLRRRCDQVGARLIYDEVQTGMGRLGRPFAAGIGDVLPDMLTLAKGAANGIPIGAVLMQRPVWEPVRIGELGSTFGGGPVACAALLAVLDTIHSEDLVAQATRFEHEARKQLVCGPVLRIRGRGCLLGLELDREAKVVQRSLLQAGFITGTSDARNVLRLLPPLNTPLEALAALRDALLGIGE